MQRDRRFVTLIRLLALAAVVFAFSGLFAGSAEAKDKTDVQLNLMTDLNGDFFIQVLPSYAKIWRNKPDKPKKIEWESVNNSPFEDLFWELRYDPSKGGSSADYFGDVDLQCGELKKQVQPDKKPEIPNAEWPYSVTVYACVDGVKMQKIATIDPRIIWKD